MVKRVHLSVSSDTIADSPDGMPEEEFLRQIQGFRCICVNVCVQGYAGMEYVLTRLRNIAPSVKVHVRDWSVFHDGALLRLVKSVACLSGPRKDDYQDTHHRLKQIVIADGRDKTEYIEMTMPLMKGPVLCIQFLDFSLTRLAAADLWAEESISVFMLMIRRGHSIVPRTAVFAVHLENLDQSSIAPAILRCIGWGTEYDIKTTCTTLDVIDDIDRLLAGTSIRANVFLYMPNTKDIDFSEPLVRARIRSVTVYDNGHRLVASDKTFSPDKKRRRRNAAARKLSF